MVRLQTIYLSKECNPEVLAKKSFTTSHHINNLVVRFSLGNKDGVAMKVNEMIYHYHIAHNTPCLPPPPTISSITCGATIIPKPGETRNTSEWICKIWG